MRKPAILALVAVIPLAWCSSCATPGRSAVVKLDAESARYLEAARYQEAIDVYRQARARYPDDKAVAAGFAKTLDGICDAGDKAIKSGDFAAAERIFIVLQNNIPVDEALVPPPSFTRAELEIRIKTSRVSLAVERADRSVRAGEFPKAVEGLRALVKAYPQEPLASAKAVGVLEKILTAAKSAGDKEDFPRAGLAYYSLRKSYPLFPGAGKKLSFNMEGLDSELGKCRTALTRRGLELYRSGELAAAISVWKSLLLFDPDNAQIKKSIESATAQLKRVRSGGW
jgi:tetratricopeptide (TPR) repeat protein